VPPTLPSSQLCATPPWPGQAISSFSSIQGRRRDLAIVAPSALPHQRRFLTLIENVDEQLRMGRFHPTKGAHGPEIHREWQGIAKYIFSADLIRVFMRGLSWQKAVPATLRNLTDARGIIVHPSSSRQGANQKTAGRRFLWSKLRDSGA
jgi:hypothetical protein